MYLISYFALETDAFSLFRQPSTIGRCYPSEPESGAAPEDDDISEETEENPDVVEDSDASEEEEYDDDTLLTARRRRRVDDDLIETAESSPSGRNDDDADVTHPNASVPEASAAPRKPSGFFADEDDLMSIS